MELVTAQPWLQDDGSVITWGDPGAGGVIPLEVPVVPRYCGHAEVIRVVVAGEGKPVSL